SMALWVDGTPYLTSHGNSSNGYHAIGFSVPNNVSYVGMPVYVQFVRRFSFLGVDRWQSSAANKTTIWQ
ncbi:MAG TPA: hypothetical protein VFB71_12655, partial [Ramlibacter sp.]|nr:hypothetical protein [Ramlibacter sp.]